MADRANWREIFSHFFGLWSPLFGLTPKLSKNWTSAVSSRRVATHQTLLLRWKHRDWSDSRFLLRMEGGLVLVQKERKEEKWMKVPARSWILTLGCWHRKEESVGQKNVGLSCSRFGSTRYQVDADLRVGLPKQTVFSYRETRGRNKKGRNFSSAHTKHDDKFCNSLLRSIVGEMCK